MGRGSGKAGLLAALASTVVVFAANNNAFAGGFAIREQSTVGLGSAFAGIAAGGALSSMFWNPATLTQIPGVQAEDNFTGVMPSTSHSYTASTPAAGVPALYANNGDNSGRGAIVTSSYQSYQVNDRLWLGIGINAPFGLSVGFPRTWAGAAYGQNTNITTYDFTPTVAYRFNNWLSVGVGLQAQYMKVGYDALVSPFPVGIAQLKGSGWGWGWTAGVTVTPTPTTMIGIGYRSGIDQDLGGTFTLPAGMVGTAGSVNTTVKLPDTLTFGLRQKLNERLTLLVGGEWSNWSRIGTSTVLQPSGAPATLTALAIPVTLPFQYDDGWFVSVGGEYQAMPGLTLRAGFGFEKSPITDAVRTPRLPDNDRLWFSAGASYQHPQFKALTIDLAFTYIAVDNASINISPTSGNPSCTLVGAACLGGTYIGSASPDVAIISLGIRYKTDEVLKMLMKG